MPFSLPDLPYAHDALEPHIDAKTMEIHHGKHHNGYTTKLNAALKGHEEMADKSIEDLLRNIDDVPQAIRGAVRNNGGGFSNHSLFWSILSPDGGDHTPMASQLDEAFGSFVAFRDQFSSAAGTRFGSGWAWLVVDGFGKLKIYSTANQDSPLMQGDTPILGLDVWEHAYYLNYQNRRPDYVSAFFDLVNWKQVKENYRAARG